MYRVLLERENSGNSRSLAFTFSLPYWGIPMLDEPSFPFDSRSPLFSVDVITVHNVYRTILFITRLLFCQRLLFSQISDKMTKNSVVDFTRQLTLSLFLGFTL